MRASDARSSAPTAHTAGALASARAPVWLKPTIGWTVGLVVAVASGLWLLGVLGEVVTWILLALFFSFALEPAVNWLHARGWRRGAATGLLLALAFLLFVVLLLVVVPTLIRGTQEIVDRIPEWSADATAWLSDTFGIEISNQDLTASAESTAESLETASPVSVLLGATTSLIGGIFEAFTVGMFVFYMVAEGPRFKRSVLSLFPTRRQEELVSIWEAAIDKTGGYFYSKLVLAAVNGGLFFVVLRLLDVPGAAPLALFQGFVAAFIPIVGTYVAAAVPLTVALLSVGMPETLILLGYELVYQQTENYLISPRIQGRTMQLHPAIAFGAALAGAALGGLLWAFLALPFAATVQASASLWVEQHEVLETDLIPHEEPAADAAGSEPSLVARSVSRLRSARGWLRRGHQEAG